MAAQKGQAYAAARRNSEPSSEVENEGSMAKWIRVLAGSCECIAVVAKRLNLVEDYESLLEPKKAGERSFSVGSEREEAEDALVS